MRVVEGPAVHVTGGGGEGRYRGGDRGGGRGGGRCATFVFSGTANVIVERTFWIDAFEIQKPD